VFPLKLGHRNNFSGFESRAAELQRWIYLISESVPLSPHRLAGLTTDGDEIHKRLWVSQPLRCGA